MTLFRSLTGHREALDKACRRDLFGYPGNPAAELILCHRRLTDDLTPYNW